MFRCIEQEDGSTLILDRSSGKQLCLIPSPSLHSSDRPANNQILPNKRNARKSMGANSLSKQDTLKFGTPNVIREQANSREKGTKDESKSEDNENYGQENDLRILRPRERRNDQHKRYSKTHVKSLGGIRYHSPYDINESSSSNSEVFSHLTTHEPEVKEVPEPETDCIDEEDFFRYLGLLPNRLNNRQSDNYVSGTWPIRDISKRNPAAKINLFKLPPNICFDRNEGGSKMTTTVTKSDSSNVVPNSHPRKPITSDSNIPAPLHDYLVSGNKSNLNIKSSILLSKNESTNLSQPYRHVIADNVKRFTIIMNQTKSFINKISNKLEISSPLGKKVLDSVPHLRIRQSLNLESVRAYEKYCGTNKNLISNILGVQNAQVETFNPKSRLTRANGSGSWTSSNHTHLYMFNKAQRLERWSTLESGLNWQSRLLKLCCRSCRVLVKKLEICPLCKEILAIGHSCGDDPKKLTGKASFLGNNSKYNGNSISPELIAASKMCLSSEHNYCSECTKPASKGNKALSKEQNGVSEPVKRRSNVLLDEEPRPKRPYESNHLSNMNNVSKDFIHLNGFQNTIIKEEDVLIIEEIPKSSFEICDRLV